MLAVRFSVIIFFSLAFIFLRSTSFSSMNAVVIKPLAKHNATLIFLHGLGDSGHGWSELGLRWQRTFPSVKFIFPHAPTMAVSINMGMRMPSWYDISGPLDERARHDEKGLESSKNIVLSIVEKEIKESGIEEGRIVIGGFSQGGAVSLYTLTNSDNKSFGGCVVLSSYLPGNGKGNGKQTPIYMAHGTNDFVVDYKYGVKSSEMLKSLGYKVNFSSFKGMEHSACEEEIVEMEKFLKRVFE